MQLLVALYTQEQPKVSMLALRELSRVAGSFHVLFEDRYIYFVTRSQTRYRESSVSKRFYDCIISVLLFSKSDCFVSMVLYLLAYTEGFQVEWCK